MSKFEVGDKVRVRHDAIQHGWLRLGEDAVITGRYESGDLYRFENPTGGAESRYYDRELVLVARKRKFQVGDRVRVNETQPGGWAGHYGTVVTNDENSWMGDYRVKMEPNQYNITTGVLFHGHELDAAPEVEAPVEERKKVAQKDVNRLLKKARKVQKVYDNPESTLGEYLDALHKFEKAVEEVVNK